MQIKQTQHEPDPRIERVPPDQRLRPFITLMECEAGDRMIMFNNAVWEDEVTLMRHDEHAGTVVEVYSTKRKFLVDSHQEVILLPGKRHPDPCPFPFAKIYKYYESRYGEFAWHNGDLAFIGDVYASDEGGVLTHLDGSYEPIDAHEDVHLIVHDMSNPAILRYLLRELIKLDDAMAQERFYSMDYVRRFNPMIEKIMQFENGGQIQDEIY